MASTFRPATDLLKMYAEYHRDRRNIATHLVGVPLIVFGIGVVLAGVHLGAGNPPVTLAAAVWALTTLWYLTRGHLGLGLAVSAFNGVLIALAHPVAAGSASTWLGWGMGVFAFGWMLQFLGHYYEGRKPAFADDIVGLLVGPMFVVLEMLSLLGLFKGLMTEIEHHAGPTRIRDLAHPAL
jgi:uncharacterized membrane protein YGL010W